MPKPATYPTLIENEKTLKVSTLSKCKALKPGQETSITTGWTSKRGNDLDILITCKMELRNERIILDYIDFKGNTVKEMIYLTSTPANIGNGLIWWFICPYTHTRCRNLIFINGYFMHRSNLVNAMYSTQSNSRYWRTLFKLKPDIPTVEKIFEQPYQPYYKRYYNGKITKRYKKYLDTLQKWKDNDQERMNLFYSHL